MGETIVSENLQLLRLLKKHNILKLPVFFFFFSPQLFRNDGKFGAKNHFTDLRTANTIHLFVAIKRKLFRLILFLSKFIYISLKQTSING